MIEGPVAKNTDPMKQTTLPGDAMPYITTMLRIAESDVYDERGRPGEGKVKLKGMREQCAGE